MVWRTRHHHYIRSSLEMLIWCSIRHTARHGTKSISHSAKEQGECSSNCMIDSKRILGSEQLGELECLENEIPDCLLQDPKHVTEVQAPSQILLLHGALFWPAEPLAGLAIDKDE